MRKGICFILLLDYVLKKYFYSFNYLANKEPNSKSVLMVCTYIHTYM